MRTKYCGNLTVSDIDKKVTLCGWVDRKRNFGNFIFIDLRDCTGIIQIFFHSKKDEIFQDALKLKNEFCIQISGIVKKRKKNHQNLSMYTGNIEIHATNLNIINISQILPLDINNINEEKVRLKYRYLDLRRSTMFKNLKIRHKIVQYIRKFLNKKKFIDIETPVLVKLTPEGAKNYLVSSRIHQKKYYALSQSPQIFKQLFMIAGIDKYYQIARCFRDEDLRSDRQPEFTQIDIEAAFIDEIYIKQLTESIVKMLWKNFLNYEINTIPCITFQESMKKYGSDKPDLRNPIILHNIKKFIHVNQYNKSVNNEKIVAIIIPQGILKFTQENINDLNQMIKKYNILYHFYIYVKNIYDNQYDIKISDIFFQKKIITNIIHKINSHNNDIILIISGRKEIIYQLFQIIKNYIAKKLDLIKKNNWKPIWITDFPMFQKNQDNSFTTTHHPFTAPKNFDIRHIKNNNLNSIIANSYDLVINGYEIGGGSVRIHDVKIQKMIFEILNISTEKKEDPFHFFINALKYGTPPHAGIALGLDRLVMLLTNNNNIKDVIAFPKTNTSTCLMTGAPSYLIN
ncbi:aspartate--tRNA ligase [Buchnera aphidicola]|uniref:Aspartate--tRNA ligase n=1 Tax=Buchnera aphidicola (Sarucallis kahawaluokalani) TaxID=1241878 RepID=A0A4D6YI28_9GAMM|nr:aspartate--tRNA ligase [Buchnera aphidicola]QCI26011.1 aspartate--tRNA ligase [Buchnera aphidicola (Sarucallis kahawaluokalani)]